MNRRSVTRRAYLAGATVPPSLSVVGCLGGEDEDWDGTTPDEIDDVCERTETDVWCGEADPISIEVSYDDTDAFRVSNGQVINDGVPWAFEEWGEVASRGYKVPDVVFDHVRDALDDESGVRTERSSGPHPDDVSVPVVGVYTGDEAFDDPVGLEAVRAVVPRYVDSTASIEELSYRQAVPLFVTTYDNPRRDL